MENEDHEMAAIARQEAAEIFGLQAETAKEKPEMEPRRRDSTQVLEESSGAKQSGASRRQRATGGTTARETTVANGATTRTSGRTSPRR